jgi:hypothetical protein
MVRKSGTYLPKESGITFPSEKMRHQLTRFKSVEFVKCMVKALSIGLYIGPLYI